MSHVLEYIVYFLCAITALVCVLVASWLIAYMAAAGWTTGKCATIKRLGKAWYSNKEPENGEATQQ